MPSGWLCSLMPDQPVMVHAAYPTPELGNPSSQRTSSPTTYNPLAYLPAIRHNFQHDRRHFSHHRTPAPTPTPRARTKPTHAPLCARFDTQTRDPRGFSQNFFSLPHNHLHPQIRPPLQICARAPRPPPVNTEGTCHRPSALRWSVRATNCARFTN